MSGLFARRRYANAGVTTRIRQATQPRSRIGERYAAVGRRPHATKPFIHRVRGSDETGGRRVARVRVHVAYAAAMRSANTEAYGYVYIRQTIAGNGAVEVHGAPGNGEEGRYVAQTR